jgi:heterodisulfide reductase subunit C
VKVDKDLMISQDQGFSEEVARRVGIDEIRPCLSCGACTGVCPVKGIFDEFDPRLIIHWIGLGMRERVLGSKLIWLCCLCNTCYHVCPQKISFSRIARELRKMAIEGGYVDREFLNRFKSMERYFVDLCRRTLFRRIKDGFHGPHRMPCWRKETIDIEG